MKPHNFSPILKSSFTLTAAFALTMFAAGNVMAQSPQPQATSGSAQAGAATQAERPKYPNYPSETPAQLKPATSSFDFERREVMIAMRDGVRLHTVILVPRSATKSKPAAILLTRTPYSADELTTHAQSLAPWAESLWL
jgi:predicted acyl esterase